jgi:hypothetical protein
MTAKMMIAEALGGALVLASFHDGSANLKRSEPWLA